VAKPTARRQRGTIRKRGKSLQVTVYAGLDPLTGKRMFLSESTTDTAEAERIRKRLVAQVDDQRGPKTSATFGRALDAWLRTHEAEETTLDGYRGYVRRTIGAGARVGAAGEGLGPGARGVLRRPPTLPAPLPRRRAGR